MKKTTNTMQLCPQGVYGIPHQSYKLTIYNLLHLGQISCVTNTEIWQAIHITLITDLLLKRVRKGLNTEFKRIIIYTYVSIVSFLSTMSAIFSQSFSRVLSVFCIVWLIVFSISLQTSSIWFAHLAGCKNITLKTMQANQLKLTKCFYNTQKLYPCL